ncbi:MAG: L,D-transpeptidase, partial [Woeseiaceae bacterium]
MSARRQLLTLMLIMALPFAVRAEQFALPPDGNDVVGATTVVTARADETLLDIARRHGLGYEDIVRANPDVDTWLPG